MQLRLTVLGPRREPSAGRPAANDVLVTAPTGTALAAVAADLAAAVGSDRGDGPAVLYAGHERLDARRCVLGEPPLLDGAVLCLGGPTEPGPDPATEAAAQLQVIAGPDAGGVHLLHGGQIRVGRSTEADVLLDDPDVSRLHCAVTLTPEGEVTVTDLGSTNGTTIDGVPVSGRPVRLPPGALLRLGESALRLTTASAATEMGPALPTAPDGEGQVRVRVLGDDDQGGAAPQTADSAAGSAPGTRAGGAGAAGGQPASGGRGREAGPHVQGRGPGASAPGGAPGASGTGSGATRRGAAGPVPDTGARHRVSGGHAAPEGGTHHGYGSAEWGAASGAAGAGRAQPAAARGHEGRQGPERGPGRGADGAAGRDRGPGQSPGTGWDGAHGAPASQWPRSAAQGQGERAAGPGRGTGSWEGHRDAGSWDDGRDAGFLADAREAGTWAARPAAGSPGDVRNADSWDDGPQAGDQVAGAESWEAGTPLQGMPVSRESRRRGGFSAWARRITGGRAEDEYTEHSGPGGSGPGGPGRPGADELRYAYGSYGGPGTPGAGYGDVMTHIVAEPGRRGAVAGAATGVCPDPAALLLTALGPAARLWERGPGHAEALTVRLGTTDGPTSAGPRRSGASRVPLVPVTVGLREVGALGLAGPRQRLLGLVRSVVAQLAALHSPDTLEIVLISSERTRTPAQRAAEWAWLGWLPHLRPVHGQDCRLLLAHDRDQATARADELIRRLEDRLAARAGVDDRVGASGGDDAHGHGRYDDGRHAQGRERHTTGTGPNDHPHADGASTHPYADDTYTVVIVDGDPGAADLRAAVERLVIEGPDAGMHVLCLAETGAVAPAVPLEAAYDTACEAVPAFRWCTAVALLSGDVATALRLLRTARGRIVGPGRVAALDAVSAAWAERFARALAPLRPASVPGEGHARASTPLPQAARLLDELGLARATPASLQARWAAAADDRQAPGGRAVAVLGAGPRGPVGVDLVAEGPHLLVEGPAGSGRTELLRAVAASLAAAERPARLGLVLIDGRDTTGSSGVITTATSRRTVPGSGGAERAGGGGAGGPGGSSGRAAGRSGAGEGLRICMDLPHVSMHLAAHDPVRMREFAQSLTAELKRRAELLGPLDFGSWHAEQAVSWGSAPGGTSGGTSGGSAGGGAEGPGAEVEAPSGATLRLRPASLRQRQQQEASDTGTGPVLPRIVVLVDDVDALLAPPLGSPGRPAAGSVVRALEAVARDGARLGVHLVATAGPPGGRVDDSDLGRCAALRVALEAPSGGAEDPAPGRGRLRLPDGRGTAFQGGRVTGRIPRTGTSRPTVMPLEWERMGDPPARRSVRELGNGPTDLALLASALERAARAEVRGPR